jgi:hypothetical protein
MCTNVRISAFSVALIITVGAWQAKAQDTKSQYPSMAPLDRYMMADRNSEIALARSAAPESISGGAEVLVLGRKGFETAFRGKNGFVCMVERSWSAGTDDPEFWNPKIRAPVCMNPAAARSYLPHTITKAEVVIAGRSRSQMSDAIHAALAKKELASPEPGAMCYMMSKQGYLSDRDGHWRPHLMFFTPPTDPTLWGANLPGSPVIAFKDDREGMSIFLVPVGQWSDGTAAAPKVEH